MAKTNRARPAWGRVNGISHAVPRSAVGAAGEPVHDHCYGRNNNNDNSRNSDLWRRFCSLNSGRAISIGETGGTFSANQSSPQMVEIETDQGGTGLWACN
jgi:hypothetical protein